MRQREMGNARALVGVALLVAAFAACAPAPPLGSSATATASPSPQAPTAACPAWTAPQAPASIPAPSGGSTAAVATYDAALVSDTPRPIRNLYSITQRLVRHSTAPIPCRVRATPRDERVGHVASFYVVNASQTGYHQIRATLVAETPHVYMYLENGAQADHAALANSAATFEQHTYSTDRAYFGSQWLPGPDDDPHITILNADGLGPIGGYFSSEDEYPRSVFAYSNERQMIYVNLDGGEVPGTPDYDATLAHEFQHMIHWYWHPADGSWANEGSSVLAQHLNGYSAGGVDQAFLAQPATMLGGWTDDEYADIAHYGAAYLFMDYFTEHYGGSAVLRELLTDPRQVPLNFDDVLRAHDAHTDFNGVFANFVLANLLNDPNLAGGLYSYPSIPGEIAQPQHSISGFPYSDGSAAAPATLPQYAAEYYAFTPPAGGSGSLRISFQGDPYTSILANAPYGGARNEWWSNSGNDMDTTLTRAFDLSALAGHAVTLSFQAWYDLEPGYDYGYVEVSTDGGQTWTTLPATTSTQDNPNGANYGYGITGVSGAAANQSCGPQPQWVPERVSLSAYAGKRILLRFETITDDAVHCPGLALDDIRIPQLGFSDGAASADGWQAAGWLRTTNLLPEQYVLRAVVYSASGAAPRVVTVPVSAATGAGAVSISGFGGAVSRVVLAVSALAPGTVVPARYAVSARLG